MDIHDDMVREIRKLEAAHTELLKQAKGLRDAVDKYAPGEDWCPSLGIALINFDKYLKETDDVTEKTD